MQSRIKGGNGAIVPEPPPQGNPHDNNYLF